MYGVKTPTERSQMSTIPGAQSAPLVDEVEEAEFADLYRAHHAAIARYLIRRGAAQDWADLLAETFVVAWRQRGQWQRLEARQRLAWLYGVARKVLANSHRARRRAARLADLLVGSGRSLVVGADHSDLTVEQLAVAAAFDRLGDGDQEVIRLIAWDGLSPAQAAEVLGCRVATFTMRLYRARARLRKLIDQPPKG
jgi:RNA polymerase sigma-70 factor (ECF subfamily)